MAGCRTCTAARRQFLEMSAAMWHCPEHGAVVWDYAAEWVSVLAVLRALADDYEALMGDGLTGRTQPRVLAEARAALAKEEGGR